MGTVTGRLAHADTGVVALVYHMWGDRWMTPHHVLSRLGKYFHVRWLEPAHEWRDAFRSRPSPVRIGPEGDGFEVDRAPPWLPHLYRPAAVARQSLLRRLERSRRALERRGCKRFVLYLWHPQFEPALAAPGFDLRCYHVDDDYSFAMDADGTTAEEQRVLRSVDHVFAISPKLLERVREFHPDAEFAPEGVDYEAYATPVPQPEDLAAIPHPRVGYSGYLKKQLDWRLLIDLAQRHVNYSFVFVGAPSPHPEIQQPMSRLDALPNVYFLGGKPATALPGYVQHFDVCIMPYALNSYTDSIYPLKLPEYLATGRPVVGTPIRSLREFEQVLWLPSDSIAWSAALAEALSDGPLSREARARQAVARRSDWSILVDNVASSILERLRPTSSN